MKRATFTRLLATSAFVLAFATAAQAQQASSSGEAQDSEVEQESAAGQIGEIVVTATRREERLQDVPIAISAYGAAELAAAGAQNVQDLGNLTPGLTIANQSAGITPFIRGVGAVDNTVGQESAVAVYVDGVYYPSVYASLFSLNNIERIEVLKGPQGTLFGRNATGGLIHVFTRDPRRGQRTMSGSISYGNYDTVRAHAYVASGLSDTLAMDIALVKSYQGKGFGRNVTLDRDVGFMGNDSAIRSKLVWTPTDSTTIKLAGDYSLTTGSDLGAAKSFLPGSVSTLDGLPGTPGFHNVRGGAVEYIDTEQWGASLGITHDFGGISIVSLSSIRDSEVKQVFDNDATPIVFLDAYIDSQKTRTYMQELQILSDPSSPVRWIAGAFFLDDSSAFADPLGLGLIGGAVGTGALIKNRIKTRSYSAFGEVTVPLGQRTEVTAGARWTSDKRSISGRTDILDIPSPDGEIILSVPSVSQSFTENKPTWRFVLNHKFTDRVMAYASYNRGFKSGNFNTVSAADAPFRSETVDAFEVGLKSQLFDNRVRFNAAAFYYSYRNLQLSVLSGSFLTTTNAANSKIKGIDVDGEWAVTDNLRLRFGAALLDTKFDEFPNAQCSRREPNGVTVQFACDASGNQLTRSPKTTFNLSPSYTIDTGAGRFDATLNYVYNSGYFWEPDNRLKEPAYSLLSAQIGWTDPTDTYGLKLFGKNLTNTDYTLWTVAFALGDEYAAAPPRTYGVEFNFKF